MTVTVFDEFLQRFDRRARLGLAAGVLLIAGATAALGWWALRSDYQVLFADLTPQDAAAMAAELDKMKTPYHLSGAGTTILVPAEQVYKTRLKLVGKELPLHGAVGLELFNASEVGMTEFTQKVNYQRALQGELTRTILSLDEVQSARVHLVLSEQTLFKKNAKQAKASISIAMKPGRTLDAGQVSGIQRLVGAAVPDIKPEDVTIVDQHGNALTRRAASDGSDPIAGPEGADGLDNKRALESYLNKKISDVLDRTFGASTGIASVDITLNHDHVKVTTERVLGAGPGELAQAGVKVRERESARDSDTVATGASHGADNATAAVSSHEADYQVGRRVEQVVSSAGAIQRISVAVVVREALTADQMERLQEVVALAAGIDKSRGDAVAVYSVGQLANPALLAKAPIAAAESDQDAGAVAAVAPETKAGRQIDSVPLALLVVLALLTAAGMLVLAGRRLARPAAPALSAAERQVLLDKVHHWLDKAPDSAMERH